MYKLIPSRSEEHFDTFVITTYGHGYDGDFYEKEHTISSKEYFDKYGKQIRDVLNYSKDTEEIYSKVYNDKSLDTSVYDIIVDLITYGGHLFPFFESIEIRYYDENGKQFDVIFE